MAAPERVGFRPKTQDQLERQIGDVSRALGGSITSSSISGDIFVAPLDELRAWFPKRYDIYVRSLRGQRTRESLEQRDTKTLGVLNALDRYIENHHRNENGRTLFAPQMTVFEDLRDFLEEGETEGYIKLPTAAGKTVLFTEFVEATGLRTLVVVPTQFLVDQTGEKFQEFAKGVEFGKVYSDSKQYDKQVTLTTYNSFIDKVESDEIVPEDYDLLILDEGHKAITPRREALVRLFNHAIKLGFTATPKYTTYKELKQLLGHEIHSMDIPEAVKLGLLSPLSVYLAETDVDLSNIKITADREYDDGDLERAINITSRNLAAVDVYQQLFAGQKTVVYCVGIKHAEALARLFNERDIAADFVSGLQSRAEQREKLARFKNGKTDVMCNANLLIEGFDEKSVTVCLNLRPTLSPVVAEQRGGRVLRLDPNNPNKHAIIVDFIGKNTRAGGGVGKNPPITFAQILERAEVFLKTTQHKAPKTGTGTVIYPEIEISGIRVITNPEEIMRVTREAVGITEEGWYSIDALSRRLRLPEEFILRFLKLIRTVHPEYFEMRIQNNQSREFVSPEALDILKNCFDPEQLREGIQEDEFPISESNLFFNIRGERKKVKATVESVLEELMQQDPAQVKIKIIERIPFIVVDRKRFIELIRKRGLKFAPIEQIDSENEIGITFVFLANMFIGKRKKLRIDSDLVLQEIVTEHSNAFRRANINGLPVSILRKEYLSLYLQEMQKKGTKLQGSLEQINAATEIKITAQFLTSTFRGGYPGLLRLSNDVLQEIAKEHPQAWRIGLNSNEKKAKGSGRSVRILKREFEPLYMQRMREKGARLEESQTGESHKESQQDEMVISIEFLKNKFAGGHVKLRPISNAVLAQLAIEYPGSWIEKENITSRGRPSGKKLPALRREFASLYLQMMQERGVVLQETVTPIEPEHEVGITQKFLDATFIGDYKTIRFYSNAVLNQIAEEYSGAWRKARPTISGKDKLISALRKEYESLYKQLMQEGGIVLR